LRERSDWGVPEGVEDLFLGDSKESSESTIIEGSWGTDWGDCGRSGLGGDRGIDFDVLGSSIGGGESKFGLENSSELFDDFTILESTFSNWYRFSLFRGRVIRGMVTSSGESGGVTRLDIVISSLLKLSTFLNSVCGGLSTLLLKVYQ